MISIELPDCSPIPLRPPSIGSNYRSGELVSLECGSTTLILPSGDFVRIEHLCGSYSAVLKQKYSEDLTGLDGTVLRGMELKIYENGTQLEAVPTGAKITWSFLLPDSGKTPDMRFLDIILNQGKGNWIRVPERQIENSNAVIIPLHPEANDGLRFLAGSTIDPNNRFEAITNFSGIMVVVYP